MINFAIVGYGGMGEYHSIHMAKNNNFKITTIFDIDPKQMEKGRADGFKAVSSIDNIINDKSIDWVLVATPNDSHFDLAKTLLLGGKNVLLEKPATIKSEEFLELMNIAKNSNSTLLVHQNRRYDNDFLAIKKALTGCLSDVYEIESCVSASNGLPSEWRKVASQGGGMVLDWGVHLVDQAVQLFGMNIESVYARESYVYGEEVEDGFTADLTFKNGAVFKVTVNTNAFFTQSRWQVYASNASGEIADWNMPLKVRTRSLENTAKVEGIKAGNGFTKTMARQGTNYKESSYELDDIPGDIFYSELLKNPQHVDNESVYYVLKVLEAIHLSAKTKRIVTL